MDQSLATLVEDEGNAAALIAAKALCSKHDKALNYVFVGPRFSGKSTLLRACSEDLKRIDPDVCCLCTGADMKMVLDIESDDSFFEKIGSTPVLLVDSAEIALAHPAGDKLVALLIEERGRCGFDTVFALDAMPEDAGFREALPLLDEFEVIEVSPLGLQGSMDFVCRACGNYSTDCSPSIDGDAVRYLASRFEGKCSDLTNAVRYLMTMTDYGSGDILGEAEVASLLAV